MKTYLRLLLMMLLSTLTQAHANQLSSKSFENEFYEMHKKITSEFCIACLSDADPSPLIDILNRAKKAGASSFIEELKAEYKSGSQECETAACFAVFNLTARALAGAGLLMTGTKSYGFTIGMEAQEIASAINDSESNGRLATILSSIAFRSVDVGTNSKTANFSELPDLIQRKQYRDSSVLLGVKSCRDIVPWKNKRGMFCNTTTGGIAAIVPDDEFSRAVLYNAVKVGPGLLSGMIIGAYAGVPVISVSATPIQIAQFKATANKLRPSPIERIQSYLRAQPGAIREGMTLHLAAPLESDRRTGVANKYIPFFRSDNLTEFISPSGVSTVRIQFVRQYVSRLYIGNQVTPITMISYFADISCQKSILSIGPILIDSRGSDITPEYLSRFPQFQSGTQLDEYSSIKTLVSLYCAP